MRKFSVVVLVSLLLLHTVSSAVLSDGMIMPELWDTGYLVVRYHHVTVDIVSDAVGVARAVTRVEQEFVNPHAFPVKGRYLFPVPPDTMVAEFQATFNGQRQTVTRQDAATTNRVIYDLVAQRHDPSLLQYADWETLAFDLNLPAGASRTMTLEYEQVLAPTGGMYHYRYILSTERYTAQPLESVSVTVNLEASTGLGSLYSSSHNVTTERLGEGRARVIWEAQNVQPYEDFDLYFTPAQGGFGGGLLTGQREDADGEAQNHLLFLFAPETDAARDVALPKDIVFVIDRSGSMGGEKIEQAQAALQFILGQLNENDRFSIVGFDDQLVIFSETLREADRDALRDARRFVDRLYANNGTDIEGGLQTGLRILKDSEQRVGATRLLVFLTDGLPTAGITDPPLITELVGGTNSRVEARLHVFGVGYDVNTHLLDQLAAQNGGSITYVQPGENLELVLSDFYGKIANPVLTNLEIEFEGINVSDLYPRALPDMFRGSSLLLTGRYQVRGDNEAVIARVRGMAGEEAREYVYEFDLRALQSQDFVPRLWATRRIGELLDTVRVEGETAALIAEIRDLGLAYGLVTPYTTFIIAAQTTGAASADNMSLYSNRSDLNRASGQTTVQARVQNQMYQDASQANLASGANVVNSGQRSLVQMRQGLASQNVDLSLLQEIGDIDEPLSDEWIAKNVNIDRKVDFASAEYFALADDPETRQYLQSGNNVLFAHNGEIIQVWDEDYVPEDVPSWDPQALNAPLDDNNTRAPQLQNQQLPQVQPPARATGIRAIINGIVALMQAVWEAVAR